MKKAQTKPEIVVDFDYMRNLQGVIIADMFSKKFEPITIDFPQALIPLNNVPLIEYAIQFFLMNKIRNIIIFCSSFKQHFDDYFRKYKNKELISFKLVSSEDCKSMGDALRELDRMNIIQGDFVLIQSDIVANFNMINVLNFHLRKRDENKNHIITKVYRKSHLNDDLRSCDDNTVIVINNETNQLIGIENLNSGKLVNIGGKVDISYGRNCEKIRFDLIDTNVTVCSIEVLHRFMENFDYHNFRDDFLRDVLTSLVYDEKVHISILNDDEYSASVRDLRIYKCVMEDVIAQKAQPILLHKLCKKLSSKGLKDKISYIYFPDNLYIASDVERSLNGNLSGNSLIGKGTKLFEEVTIFRSSIGSDCKIGKNSKIFGCSIWDNVVIGENCLIENSLICSGVVIQNNITVKSGCVLSYNTAILSNTTLKSYSIITNKSTEENSTQFLKGNYYINNNLSQNEQFNSEIQKLEDNEDNDSLKDSEESESFQAEDETNDEKFQREVNETIHRMIIGEITMENLIIEMNALKFGENKTFSQCLKHFTPAVLTELGKIYNPKVEILIQEISGWVDFWHRLFKEYVYQEQDGIAFIVEIQKFCENNNNFKSCFHIILQFLNKHEILTDEFILAWAKLYEQDPDVQYYYKLCEAFIEWLKSKGDESEEEDEEEA